MVPKATELDAAAAELFTLVAVLDFGAALFFLEDFFTFLGAAFFFALTTAFFFAFAAGFFFFTTTFFLAFFLAFFTLVDDFFFAMFLLLASGCSLQLQRGYLHNARTF